MIFSCLSNFMETLLVKHIMTSPVMMVQSNDSIQHAANILTEHRIHGLPVVESGRIVGIVTETDFFTKDSSNLYLPSYIDFIRKSKVSNEITGSRREMVERLMSAKVQDIMSSPAKTVLETLPAKELVALFRDTGLSSFPVVNDAGDMTGIVTVSDVLQSFNEFSGMGIISHSISQ